MQITVHKSIKRPWGYETPYTVNDAGEIFNGYLLDTKLIKIDQTRIEDAIIEIKAKRDLAAETPEALKTLEIQKETLIAEIVILQKQKDDLSALTAVK
jgi:hypothetical protein